MPKQYEAIKQSLLDQGLPLKEAKSRAAAIFNSQRKPGQKPVTGPHKALRRPKGK